MIADRLTEDTMERKTLLYISDQVTSSKFIAAALNATGYEVVSTNSSTQAIALLFVMHSVAGVVLNQRAGEQSSFDVERSLRAIRPDVPIVMLCPEEKDRSSNVEPCVNTEQPLQKLTSAVLRLLLTKRS